MRTVHDYSGGHFDSDEAPETRTKDTGLRHSREYTRAQRERWIAKRLRYYPWHTAPAGLLAKWSGGPGVRRRMAERIYEGNHNPKLKRPKYPLDVDAA